MDVHDFAINLGFSNSGLDGRKDIGIELVYDVYFYKVYRKEGKNGWKLRPKNLLIAKDCQNIREKYNKFAEATLHRQRNQA